MNAELARKLAINSTSEEDIKKYTDYIDDVIETNARQGYFFVELHEYYVPELKGVFASIHVANRLITYYREKGFRVNTNSMLTSRKYIYISWSGEDLL